MDAKARQTILESIYRHLEDGEIRYAGPAAEELTQRLPDYAPGWAALGEVWLRCGRADRAAESAATACRLKPESAAMVAQLAKCLVFSGEHRQARETAERALSLQPRDHATLDTIGNVFSRLGEHQRALDIFQAALEAAPDNPTAMYNLATSLRFFDRIEEAEALLDRVLDRDPDDYQAVHSRSLLSQQTESKNHIHELRRRLDAELPWYAASHISYALGKELDDLGRAGEAFDAYSNGAALMHRHLPDSLSDDIENIDAAVAALIDDRLRQSEPAGHDCGEPIFVIGLPRTGSTLIERILESHPDVFAAGELHNFRFEAQRRIGGRSASEVYRRLADDPDCLEPAALGRAYIESTRPRTGRTLKFVDKMPRNDLWAALIHRALPNARFILTHRNPLDTGYALFRTLFHTGYHFSFDLEQIGRYLLAHRHLTEALRAALPEEALLEVSYEQLVQSPEAQTRRLLDHCGLEWCDEVLEFHRLGGAVATASSHQVRKPFHTASIGKWRRVAAQLELLRHTLAEGGIASENGEQV